MTARFLSRRGLRPRSAVGAVTALAVLGAVADFLVVVLRVLLGRWVELSGSDHELVQLTSTLGQAVTSPLLPWLEIGLLLALGAFIVMRVARRRTGRERRSSPFWVPMVGLLSVAHLWLPAVLGLLALPHLRRHHAI
ncbi:MAG: hypothetical protein QOE71_3926 [Pseudonocardiales bacterium]|nr:hypothetical protein [Pseudonocardiales bacterium]